MTVLLSVNFIFDGWLIKSLCLSVSLATVSYHLDHLQYISSRIELKNYNICARTFFIFSFVVVLLCAINPYVFREAFKVDPHITYEE